MKVPIPLNSSLCTDSHHYDIKDPSTGRDLFSKNKTYYFNRTLTNPRFESVPPGSFVTTNGRIIRYVNDGSLVNILDGEKVLAKVNSLGIKSQTKLDVDDAVISNGILFTLGTTEFGYTVTQINLISGESSKTEYAQPGIVMARFIRNTTKTIILLNTNNVIIDGVINNDETMMDYFANSIRTNLVAAEIDGRVYFTMQGSEYIDRSTGIIVNIQINSNTFDWNLSQNIPDQDNDYVFNINIAPGVSIGTNANYAMDLVSGIENPGRHKIIISMGSESYISGRGGRRAGAVASAVLLRYNSTPGTHGIYTASECIVRGYGILQGGGGGGGYIDGSGFAWGVGGGSGAGYAVYDSDATINTPGSGTGTGYPGGYPGNPGNGPYSSAGGKAAIVIGSGSISIDPSVTVRGEVQIP